VFARAEALTKTGEELALPMEMADQKFGIGALSAGYIYDFQQFGSFVPGIGAVATVDVVGPTLGGIYDTRTPWGGMVFVRLRPPMMKMKMGGMQHSGVQHSRTPSNAPTPSNSPTQSNPPPPSNAPPPSSPPMQDMHHGHSM
jgi:hypothetical protein